METSIRTVTTNHYLLEMDDREMQAAIADPYSLLPALRLLYASDADPASVAVHVRQKRQKRAQKKITRRAQPGRRRKPIDREPCEACGVEIPAYKQGKHKCKMTDLVAD